MKTKNANTKVNVPVIRYDRFKELTEAIRECKRQTESSGESCCLAIEGEPGAGKTTLVLDYVARFPRIQTKDGAEIPALFVETPSPVTVKGMASHMLEVMGDPCWDKGTIPSMNSRLKGLITDCKVEVIVLDDFHHLIHSETKHVLNTVADWLKVLIKCTRVTFVVVSKPGKVDPILNENDQLSRLFRDLLILEPFSWDVKQKNTMQEFSSFIRMVENSKLPLTTRVPRIELLSRIFYATRGNVANIINLFNFAMSHAIDHNRKTLELDSLSVACQARLLRHMRLKVNPFEIGEDQMFLKPNPPYLVKGKN